MRTLKRTAIASAAAQVALLCCGVAMAQTAPAVEDSATTTVAPGATQLNTVVVTGQRKALETAQKRKQNAEDSIESVTADDAGKLPDKSITEVLQRVVGVTMDRNRSHGDPEHFSVEGSGIQIRGLTWGSSTLNGRESFSAGWPGRELSWGDVPPELMQGVDVHKNPPSELIEGGISGQVDLRTHLPFDFQGTHKSISLSDNYTAADGKNSPAASAMVSTRWDADSGRWGALLDLSYNKSTSKNDTIQLGAYLPRTEAGTGRTLWAPSDASWRTNTNENERAGIYAALQWKKNDLESAVTFFQSGFQENGVENALFGSVDSPYLTHITNAKYDANGVFQSGTYSLPLGGIGANRYTTGGVGINMDTGYNTNNSQTRELAWNFKWRINDRWAVRQDLQWVHAWNSSQGGNVTMGAFVPSFDLNAAASPVTISFSPAATAALADPSNFYWSNVMPSMSKANADLYAWKGDAQFNFDDAVLRDLRFGMRLTKRTSTHEDASGTGWYSIASPWAVRKTSVAGQLPTSTDFPSWGGLANVPYATSARFADMTQLYSFSNFFGGKVSTPPSVMVPSMAMVQGSYQDLANLHQQMCQQGQAQLGITPKPSNSCTEQYALNDDGTIKRNPDGTPIFNYNSGADWKPLSYDGDPSKVRQHTEDTQAIYGTLRFGFTDWKYPVEGNVGVRVVRTHTVAHGYTIFEPSYGASTRPDVPRFAPIHEPLNVESTFTDTLPSLNLKVNFTSKLQGRLALSQAMYRPGFDQLSEYIKVKQDVQQNFTLYTAENAGNVNLKPVTSDNYDVSLEWYPRNGSSVTVGVFYKDIQNIIKNTAYSRSFTDIAGNSQEFTVTGPDNVAKGRVGGIELAASTYFDQLPGMDKALPEWAKGFGISGNYTYIDSKQTLYHPFNKPYCPKDGSFNNANVAIFGCDTNGLPFKDMPLEYLSKNAFNLAFMYDKGPISARLAYSWRGRYLQAVGSNGTTGGNGLSSDPARVNPTEAAKPENIASGYYDPVTSAPRDVKWGLPTWTEAVGQWDAGVNYSLNKNLSISFDVTNLTDVVTQQTQQQAIGVMSRAWFEPGRGYKLKASYTF